MTDYEKIEQLLVGFKYLAHLYVPSNRITEFPHELIGRLDYLDVHRNPISYIDIELLRKASNLGSTTVNALDTPIYKQLVRENKQDARLLEGLPF